jgi:alginate O-acetyltransferase complex protein AlgI
MVSWVFFRADTLNVAIAYLNAMFDPGRWTTTESQFAEVMVPGFEVVLCAGLVLCFPVYRFLGDILARFASGAAMEAGGFVSVLRVFGLTLLMGMCILAISAATYNPFIYFRF